MEVGNMTYTVAQYQCDDELKTVVNTHVFVGHTDDGKLLFQDPVSYFSVGNILQQPPEQKDKIPHILQCFDNADYPLLHNKQALIEELNKLG